MQPKFMVASISDFDIGVIPPYSFVLEVFLQVLATLQTDFLESSAFSDSETLFKFIWSVCKKLF